MGSSDDQNSSSGNPSSDSPPSDSSSSSKSPPSSSSSSSPSPPSSGSGSPPSKDSSSSGDSSSSNGSSSSNNSNGSSSSNNSNGSSNNSNNSSPSSDSSKSSNNSGNSSSSNNSGNSSSSNNSGNSSNNSNNNSPPSNNNSNNSPASNNDSNNSNNKNSNNGNNDSNNGNNNNSNNSNNNSNNNNSNNNSNNNNSNNSNNSSQQTNNQKSPPQSNSHNSPPSSNSQSPPKSSNGNNWSPKSSNDFSPPALESSSSRSHQSSDESPPPTHSSSTSTPIIIGVVAGAGLLLLVLVLFFLACSKRRKKRQTSSHLMENPDPYRPNGSDYWQSTGPKSTEHVLNMPPSGRAPNGGWTTSTAPHPMMSSDMSSSNFSGPHGPPLPPPHPNVALGFNKSTFTYDELAAATSGFSPAKLLGQGGFGYVHKGVLPNGKEIAVKSLKAGSGQGEREFSAEVEIISRVHHRHLVSLVGYCLSGDRKLLVYEFVANNNLEFHLHGANRPPLEWSNRVKIALGSAKGLAYLHEDCHPKIIHRDIKTANILIDYSFEAKVADFGLAKLNQENVTHVSTRVMGTFGYLAPEYASTGKLTEKSDVFSFGIMLLEMITGRRPVDLSGEMEEDTLVDWARPLCQKAIDTGDYSELLDPRLENNYNHEQMARMVACAAASVRHSAKKRPKMSQIVRALEGDVSMEDLHEGIKGSFGSGSTSMGSSEFDADSYNAKMRGLRKPALMDTTDYPSSEYGATSEYGHPSSTPASSNHSQEMDNKKGINRPQGPV